MSAIYDNAIDSLRIGFEFFKQDTSYSSRKHAILTIFHALELFLKEELSGINPALIYKNIDTPIKDDSPTVGMREMLVRLENLGRKLPDDQVESVKNLQRIRNRIEHHRYDHNAKEDNLLINECLRVILFHVEFSLGRRLADDLGSELFTVLQARVLEFNEMMGLAEHRLNEWMQERFPDWGGPEHSDTPGEFRGTHDCPACMKSWLVIGYGLPEPFCFLCNTGIDAASCENCGRTYMMGDGCCGPFHDEEEAPPAA